MKALIALPPILALLPTLSLPSSPHLPLAPLPFPRPAFLHRELSALLLSHSLAFSSWHIYTVTHSHFLAHILPGVAQSFRDSFASFPLDYVTLFPCNNSTLCLDSLNFVRCLIDLCTLTSTFFTFIFSHIFTF